jgi:hypothetical protein
MLLTACGTSSRVAAPRSPDPALLLPCVDPALVPDPDSATDNDIAIERVRVAEAYVACKRRHQDLVTFEKGGKP